LRPAALENPVNRRFIRYFARANPFSFCLRLKTLTNAPLFLRVPSLSGKSHTLSQRPHEIGDSSAFRSVSYLYVCLLTGYKKIQSSPLSLFFMFAACPHEGLLQGKNAGYIGR